MTQIWINDSLLDVYPDTVVAQTFKAYDLTRFGGVYRNFTNTFKIPYSENNDTILGNAKLVQSDTSIPYAANMCRVIQNGVEIVNNGIPVIKDSNNGYTIFVISGLSFFETIANLKLEDLDFTGGINGALNTTLLTTTSDRINPVMNYGRFDIATYTMSEENTFPSWYYHSLISSIFSDAGLAKSGDIFTDAKYLATVIPYGRSDWAYGESFKNSRMAIADKLSSQAILNANFASTTITFPTVVFEGSLGFYDESISEYIVLEADATTGDKLMLMDVLLTIDITVTGGTVDLFLEGAAGDDILLAKGTGVYTATANNAQAWVNAGIKLKVRTDTGTPDITINSGRIQFIPTLQPFPGLLSYVYFNLLLPDFSQKDLIRDFSLRFGQIMQEKDGTVFCKSIDDIISNTANAVDWTEKRVRQPDKITYTPSGYGKKNFLKYKNEDFEVAQDFGEASFDIANTNLKDETILTSAFGASNTILQGDIYMAKVNIYDNTQSNFFEAFTFDPGIRVLLVRDSYSYESDVRARSGEAYNSTYKVAYFDDPLQANTCLYQQTIDNEYPLLVSSLQKYKHVTRDYNLTESDIQNLDFFLPVFDTDSYYILDTVGPYISGRLTKVTMMKV